MFDKKYQYSTTILTITARIVTNETAKVNLRLLARNYKLNVLNVFLSIFEKLIVVFDFALLPYSTGHQFTFAKSLEFRSCFHLQ